MSRSRLASRLPRSFAVAAASVLGLSLAGCQAGASERGAAGSCDLPREVRLVIPFSPGGGYDSWGRTMAPHLADELGVGVVVENLDGGGGMRGINTVYSGPANGSSVVIFSPQDAALAQVMGHAGDAFDLSSMTFLAQFTEDPQVFLVKAGSGLTMEELVDAEEPAKHAGQELSPVELLTYDRLGVEADFILHEGTPEVSLAVQRGDADVTVGSLSSVLDFVKGGVMEPILVVSKSPLTEGMAGYEELEGVPTVEDLGYAELASELSPNRVVAAAPKTPDCLAETMSDALAEVLGDPAFEEEAKELGLEVLFGDAAVAAESAESSLGAMEENKAVLQKAIGE